MSSIVDWIAACYIKNYRIKSKCLTCRIICQSSSIFVKICWHEKMSFWKLTAKKYIFIYSVWNKDFSLGRLFFWKKQKTVLIKQEIQKSVMGVGVIVTYAHSMGFVYFLIWIVQSCPFLMSLMNLFSNVFSRFHQNLSHHLIIEQIPTTLEF